MKKVLIISLLVIAAIIAVSVWVKNSETYKESPNTSQGYEEKESNSDMESYFAKLEAKEKEISDFSCKIITKSGENITLSNYIKKNGKKRIDNKTGEIETISIFDNENKTVTTYLPNEKKAFVEAYDPSSKSSCLLSNSESLDKNNMVKEEAIEINGYPCQMLADKGGNVKMCVSEEYGIPIYAMNGNTEMQITEISVEPVEEIVFSLPENVQVIKR